MGQILNAVTNKRICFNSPHPIIFQRLPFEMSFKAGVEKDYFLKLKEKFSEFKRIETQDVVSISSHRIRKISNEEGTIYQKKIKRSSFDIYLPDHKYDVRISISIEEDIPREQGMKKFESRRNRKRGSFLCNEYR